MSDWLLSFDASTPVPVITLGRVGVTSEELVASEELRTGANQASQILVPTIEAIIRRADIELSDLAAIGCGRGPGTFTGSRVAVATAKGLALGLGIDVLPISTLAALAAGSGADGNVLAVLDARRGEVYGAFFAVEGSSVARLSEERCLPLPALLELEPALSREDAGLCVRGPGVEPNLHQLPPNLRDRASPSPGLDAAGLWRASVHAYRSEAPVPPAAVSVCYLRASYAEMGINTPKRAPKKSPFV